MSNRHFIAQFKQFVHMKAKEFGYEPLVQAAYDAWIESEAGHSPPAPPASVPATRAKPAPKVFSAEEAQSLRRFRERRLPVSQRRTRDDSIKYLTSMSLGDRPLHITDIMRRYNLSLAAAHGLVTRAKRLGFRIEMIGEQGNRNTKYRVFMDGK